MRGRLAGALAAGLLERVLHAGGVVGCRPEPGHEARMPRTTDPRRLPPSFLSFCSGAACTRAPLTWRITTTRCAAEEERGREGASERARVCGWSLLTGGWQAVDGWPAGAHPRPRRSSSVLPPSAGVCLQVLRSPQRPQLRARVGCAPLLFVPAAAAPCWPRAPACFSRLVRFAVPASC